MRRLPQRFRGGIPFRECWDRRVLPKMRGDEKDEYEEADDKEDKDEHEEYEGGEEDDEDEENEG